LSCPWIWNESTPTGEGGGREGEGRHLQVRGREGWGVFGLVVKRRKGGRHRQVRGGEKGGGVFGLVVNMSALNSVALDLNKRHNNC